MDINNKIIILRIGIRNGRNYTEEILKNMATEMNRKYPGCVEFDHNSRAILYGCLED